MTEPVKASKVVIVEDDVDLAEIYKTRLQILGYDCYVAHEGIEALAVIEKIRPNLVLLDIMLPKLSGDLILKTIRSVSWGKDIRVMVISNLNEADAPAGIREQGIEGYAVKANMVDGEIDLLVNNILNPDGKNQELKQEPPKQPENDRDPTVVPAPPDENSL